MDEIAARIKPDDLALGDWCQGYWSAHQNRFKTDLRLVADRVPSSSRILEVGSTPPFLTAALAEKGYDVVGVDLDPSRFSNVIAEFGLDVRACDIEKERFPFDDAEFDVVLFNEVFEHLRINPIATMREVRRVMKPGGLLMLSTPNLYSARGIANLLLHQKAHAVAASPFTEYSKLEKLGHMGHVREYTARELTDFLQAIGFRVDDVVYRGASSRKSKLVGRVVPTAQPFMSLLARA